MRDLYERWNAALAEHFFRKDLDGRQVFLFVDDGLITDLAREHDLPQGSFLEAVGARGAGAATVARRCLSERNRMNWRNREIGTCPPYPPYLAYLALFVLVAGLDAHDLPDNAYYDRLNRYLGLADGTHLPAFDRLGDEVWKDLEAWSVADMDGRFGVFEVRVYGRQRHVGIPRSQTLLAEEELKALPRVFAAAGLDPTDDPSDHLLVRTLELHARGLRPPTRRALWRPSEDALRAALLETIRSELAGWDGTIADSGGEATEGSVFGSLRIFLSLNPGKLTGTSTIRCTLKSSYPEHELSLTHGDQIYTCDELSAPWSTTLVDEENRQMNAADLDWSAGLKLVESNLGWQFTMRPTSIRIFESAERFGLRGWVEVSQLDRGKTFLIACRDKDLDPLLAWGRSSCGECSKQNYVGLLPGGWHLLKIRDVHDDKELRDISPSAGLPSSVQIRLVGGVKSGRGANYYAFAPPRIGFSGVSGRELAFIDDHVLDITRPGPISLPDGLPRGEQIKICIRNGDRTLRSQSLILLDDIDWTSVTTDRRADRFGRSAGPPGFCGAFADNSLAKAASFNPGVVLPPARKAVLLGRRPGEVCDWPAEPWPDWPPVWAITPSVRGRRHRPVVYCGSNIDESQPNPNEPTADRRLVRRWKEQTWRRRKHNITPANHRLRVLWLEYVHAGRP